MSNEHSDSPAGPKPDLGEQVDENASTITLSRSDVMGSLRVPSPNQEQVDDEEATAEAQVEGRLAEFIAATAKPKPEKVTPHLGEEVDPNEGTLTLDKAALAAALRKDDA